jgi:hypothetical protein
MSTIWEMAAIIRAEEERAEEARAALHNSATQRPAPPVRGVSVEAPGDVAYWCKYFGTTPMNLCCAIDSVGSEPSVLRRFLDARAHSRGRAGRGHR